jgi:putative sterol carrier protein
MDVAVTLTFKRGKILLKNGTVSHPKVFIGADFITLANLSAGKISAVKAMLKRKLTTRGNIFTLLKIQKLMRV